MGRGDSVIVNATTIGIGVGFLQFTNAVQEIFAVEVLCGQRFPDLINDDPELLGNSYVLPEEMLPFVQEKLAG